MKRTILLLTVLLPFALSAQNENMLSPEDSTTSLIEQMHLDMARIERKTSNLRHIKSYINLGFTGSANAYFTGNAFNEAAFKINRVCLEIYGMLSPQLSYNFRQSFNANHSPSTLEGLINSIEYANITWHPSPKFSLVVGRQFIAYGGYEPYINALRLREYSEFNSNIPYYHTGIMAAYNFNSNQQLFLQLVNQRTGSEDSQFLYKRPDGLQKSKFPFLAMLNWNAYFFQRALHLRYSAGVGEITRNKHVYYLTAGNIIEKGPIKAYIDLMYSRSELDLQGRISALQGDFELDPTLEIAQNVDYLTTVGHFEYRFHSKWSAYVKGAYGFGNIYADNGIFTKGKYFNNWNAQASVEFYPFTNDKQFRLFLHYLIKGSILTDKAKVIHPEQPKNIQRLSLGLVYIIPVL